MKKWKTIFLLTFHLLLAAEMEGWVWLWRSMKLLEYFRAHHRILIMVHDTRLIGWVVLFIRVYSMDSVRTLYGLTEELDHSSCMWYMGNICPGNLELIRTTGVYISWKISHRWDNIVTFTEQFCQYALVPGASKSLERKGVLEDSESMEFLEYAFIPPWNSIFLSSL